MLARASSLADLDAADFGPGIAHQLTLDKVLEPNVLWCVGLGIEAVFDKGKVTAQCLWQIGVRFGQLVRELEREALATKAAALA